MTLNCCLVSFHWNCRIPFSISCRACLVAIKSVSFCFSTGYMILGWQFSSFITLNLSAHCLLASNVADEKSAIIEDSWYVMNHFSSCFQDSVLLAFWQFIWFSVWISLSSAYLGLCWAFRRLIITSFQTQEVLSHYFFKQSLNPFLSLFPL